MCKGVFELDVKFQLAVIDLDDAILSEESGTFWSCWGNRQRMLRVRYSMNIITLIL
jgi:hypothetical protein